MSALFPHGKKANRLLDAFLQGEHLTVAVSLQKYQVYALSQECGRLRKLGWPIESKTVETPGAHVSEYWLGQISPIPFCGYC